MVEAARWYRLAADRGELTAQCNLASLYFRGHGVAKEYTQAATWFRAAAERGYAPAQDNLAWMYYSGTGVALDYSEAANWTRKSAQQGYAPAQVDFGYLYEQGKGVPLDYVRAYKWYKLAAAGGDDRGLARMKSLARLMTQKQISEATDRAAHFPGPRAPAENPGTANSFRSSFKER